MKSDSRYYSSMRWILTFFLVLLLTAMLQAQINGPRASVTSLGGQFNFSNPAGPRASVTSLGPCGYAPGPFCNAFGTRPVKPGFSFHHRPNRGDGFGRGRRDGWNRDGWNYGGGYPLYVMPYYYPSDVVDPVDDSMEQNYAGGGPTIFDRRGAGRDSQAYQQRLDDRVSRIEEQLDEADAKASKAAAPPEPPVPAREQPATVLIFRDGHKLEVKNYAIVGSTLYDYSTGDRHKIDLENLDLPATEKANDARGVDFRLPATRASAK